MGRRMNEQKACAVDLTGRQRSLWRRVLLRLETGGLLQASLPAGLQALPSGSPPEAWMDQAEAKGQVLHWMLRQLVLLPEDATLLGLGCDLGLCVHSRERLQASQGWRHWAGLESAAQGLQDLLGVRLGLDPRGRQGVLALEAWARRLLCLWRGEGAGNGPGLVAKGLVLDLGSARLLPLAAGAAAGACGPAGMTGWQLGALPRHALDAPPRYEACFQELAVAPHDPDLRVPTHPRLLSSRPDTPAVHHQQLAAPRGGPVLLLGADPGQPPQLCLALLQGSGSRWRHDASPGAMGGGGLCLDPDLRLVGGFLPTQEEHGCLHPLLSF